MHDQRRKTVSIPTRFQYSLSAWTQGNAESETCAILLPGFLDTKDYQHLTTIGKQLAQEGTFVLSFDPLGIWESQAPIEYYTISNWLAEVEDVIDWAKKKWQTIQHVVLIGHSLGGMVSMLFAQNHANAQAVISIMGPHTFVRKETYESRMVKWKAEQFKISHRDAPNGKESTTITLPFSFVEDSLQYDILKSDQTVACPLLLIAGEDDVLVSVEHVQNIFDHVRAKKKEMLVLSGVGHDYRKNMHDIITVNTVVSKFLQKNLKKRV